MKALGLGLISLAFAFSSSAVMANDSSPQAQAMVTVHDVDFRGKPPFRRSRETLPMSDVAELSTTNAKEIRVSERDYKGRPPFKRGTQTMEVVDIAKLETLDLEGDAKRPAPRFSGRNIGPRHRH